MMVIKLVCTSFQPDIRVLEVKIKSVNLKCLEHT